MSSGEAEFALCLTHDVDRPYKTYQAVYDAVRRRDPGALGPLVRGEDPYWQFEAVTEIESDHGVRSAFYILNEPWLLAYGPRAWIDPRNWVEHLGRYDPTAPPMAETLRRLEAGGWEVGLHGSRKAATDAVRLDTERSTLESVLEGRVVGGRHHHLTLDAPRTWRAHVNCGLAYDASLGSADPGFQHGYSLKQPFDDAEFVVFPLTLMEVGLPDPETDFEGAQTVCADLLAEAAEHNAVMTVLWHPRYFNPDEFPGYRELYDWLLGAALDRGGWVGSPAEFLYRGETTAKDDVPAGGPLAAPANTRVH